MTIPSKADIAKREQKLQSFLKRLDDNGVSSEKYVVSVVRSAIRQAWMKSDVKLAYLYMSTIPDMDDSTRTKWKVRCEICQEFFNVDAVECDHIKGGYKFTEVDEFGSYFRNILMVGFDGLQLLCKDNPKIGHVGCHSVKTLQESLGITFEEARLEKSVIAITKLKASEQDKWLAEHGVTGIAKNAKSRRDAIREVLKNESS